MKEIILQNIPLLGEILYCFFTKLCTIGFNKLNHICQESFYFPIFYQNRLVKNILNKVWLWLGKTFLNLTTLNNILYVTVVCEFLNIRYERMKKDLENE